MECEQVRCVVWNVRGTNVDFCFVCHQGTDEGRRSSETEVFNLPKGASSSESRPTIASGIERRCL